LSGADDIDFPLYVLADDGLLRGRKRAEAGEQEHGLRLAFQAFGGRERCALPVDHLLVIADPFVLQIGAGFEQALRIVDPGVRGGAGDRAGDGGAIQANETAAWRGWQRGRDRCDLGCSGQDERAGGGWFGVDGYRLLGHLGLRWRGPQVD
jgi:hypothetical protein